MMRRLIAAKWLKPCIGGSKPIYRVADVAGCLDRLSNGEVPQIVHGWRAAIGMEGSRAVAHLIPSSSTKAVCGMKGEWISASHASNRCTRCQGAAKTLRVEE
jgi:hypothetical protein